MQLNIEKKYSTTFNDESTTIYENSENFLQFNVMTNKYVSEKLIIKKYIVNSRKVEVYFDRKYQTDMLKSPDHFIFLSALVNLQKMIYVLMCKHFDIKYLPNEPEKFKIKYINLFCRNCWSYYKYKNYKNDFFHIKKLYPI